MASPERRPPHDMARDTAVGREHVLIVPSSLTLDVGSAQQAGMAQNDINQQILEGRQPATHIRTIIGKVGVGIAFAYAVVYYFKYNANDWTKKSGWRMYHSRERVVPGDPGWQKASDRTKFSDYASRGFKDSPI